MAVGPFGSSPDGRILGRRDRSIEWLEPFDSPGRRRPKGAGGQGIRGDAEKRLFSDPTTEWDRIGRCDCLERPASAFSDAIYLTSTNRLEIISPSLGPTCYTRIRLRKSQRGRNERTAEPIVERERAVVERRSSFMVWSQYSPISINSDRVWNE